MAAIAALQTALGALRRNPVLFLGGFVYALVVLPQKTLQLAGVPLLPTALQLLTFFVTPFVLAGVLGMADEAIDADTSLGTLRSVGADRYVPLLIGKFIQLAIALVFGIVFLIVGVAVVVSVGVGSVANGAVSPGILAVAGIAILLIVLAYIVVAFLIQFYPVFVVVAGSDAIDSFTDSYRFVRNNLVATLGYAMIRFIIGVVIAAPLTGFVLYRTFQNIDQFSAGAGAGGAGAGGMPAGAAGAASLFSTTEVIAIALILLAITMLGIAFQQAYAVAFYRRHTATPDATADPGAVTDDDSTVSQSDEGEWRFD